MALPVCDVASASASAVSSPLYAAPRSVPSSLQAVTIPHGGWTSGDRPARHSSAVDVCSGSSDGSRPPVPVLSDRGSDDPLDLTWLDDALLASNA